MSIVIICKQEHPSPKLPKLQTLLKRKTDLQKRSKLHGCRRQKGRPQGLL